MSILSRLRAPTWRVRRSVLSADEYAAFDAVLQISDDKDTAAPFAALFDAAAQKRGDSENPLVITLTSGTAVGRLSAKAEGMFARLTALREHLSSLTGTHWAVDMRVSSWRDAAVFAALVAAAKLPGDKGARRRIMLAGGEQKTIAAAVAAAEANTLARALAKLPPNILTVPVFARTAVSLARQAGMRAEIIDHKKLKALGAGAILAVGQASEAPPRIVRLIYTAAGAKRVALIGKGVCYDTGGVNVKPARYMRGMKGDMAGAAAALAAGLAAAQLRLPVSVEVFLALADNRIGAGAYCPDDEVVAMNGKRIEIVHSDAEGRMILADTLTLATRRRAAFDAVVSFATLTGTMVTALGARLSGFFASDENWRRRAECAAAASGERLCYFPMPADYKKALASDTADLKQCAEEGEADHILAALFLREFIHGTPPWVHLDLSASSCKGGLAAAPGPETGFGAAWALALLRGVD